MKKKIGALMLAAVIVSLTACGSGGNTKTTAMPWKLLITKMRID